MKGIYQISPAYISVHRPVQPPQRKGSYRMGWCSIRGPLHRSTKFAQTANGAGGGSLQRSPAFGKMPTSSLQRKRLEFRENQGPT